MDQAVSAAVTACLVCAALWTWPAQAQTLIDPTRPPSLSTTVPAGTAGTAVMPAGPQLQSVLISTRPDGRRVAVIDGQTVREGARFKGAVLAEITQTGVVLRYGSKRHVLKLFPAANLRAASAEQ